MTDKILSKYTELFTILAVIMAVEYASTDYDIWDLFIGILIVIVASKSTKTKFKDKYILALTSFIFALGSINILAYFMTIAKYNNMLEYLYKILITPIMFTISWKFVVFILISIGFYYYNRYKSKKIK
jgi:hypothetical protein